MNIKENKIRNLERSIGFKEAKSMMNYHQIIQAISHFNSPSNIDKRCFFLTVHQKYSLKNDIGKVVYQKLNKLLTGRSALNGNGRIGMTWEEDREGTRFRGTGNDRKHYHSLIFLPENHLLNELSDEEILAEILCELHKINETGEVHCEPYSFGKSLDQVLDYTSKYDRLDRYNAAKPNSASSIFPYHLDIENSQKRKCLSHQKLLEQYYGKLEAFYKDATVFFTEKYYHEFGAEITNFCRQHPLPDVQSNQLRYRTQSKFRFPKIAHGEHRLVS